ncbi:TetR/AcrR family transcriptional regulator [Planococcus shenhongbingii]|uniref:TetR/AcrR family transcriptional regulator n=1 Tax=Planococcus shenhongbingii TaxID=3058398 RepID=A0ABT8N9V9_9BACL|nr:TetR/AcrR family transcriptional regulator [Planococcus sp. N017]MDN7244674.1 TetR/AcrR family transcriptional regulator [Planococcus sp. N017]
MQEQASDRREQILAVALELFSNHGYHKTKVSDIVKAAGVAQGTFYWYFKSKEAIALEIIHNKEADLIEVVSQGYRESKATVQEVVKASERLFEDFFEFSQQNKYFMKLLLKGMETEESVQSAIFETRKKLENAFQKNIERAAELGILPRKDPVIQSALLMSLLEGMLERWLFSPQQGHARLQSRTAEELAKELVQFEFFGLLGI